MYVKRFGIAILKYSVFLFLKMHKNVNINNECFRWQQALQKQFLTRVPEKNGFFQHT
jgi:hypothetical protein